MEIEYLKYNPTGNITILVITTVDRALQPTVAEEIMKTNSDCEQVGFIEQDSGMHLQMMGGEFCGNASLCFASFLLDKDKKNSANYEISVSGESNPVHVFVSKENDIITGTVDMPIPLQIKEHNFDRYNKTPIVYFNGIGHAIIQTKLPISLAKMLIRQWAKELKLNALGIMILTDNNKHLDPIVYVKATDTVVHENSCASGTSAVASWLAYTTRQKVTVTLNEPAGQLTSSATFDNVINHLDFIGKTKLICKDKLEIEDNLLFKE